MQIIDKFQSIEQFGLHDSKVSKIEIINNSIVFLFSQGFWETNKQGKLIKQLQNCKMTYFFVNDLPELFITDLSKRKNVSFTKFKKVVDKYGLDINQEFRCVFSKHIILECGRYLIETDDIKEIIYDYEGNGINYSPERFIKNIEYLVKYGGEPEIEIIMKDDKKIFIIAYEDFIDFYDENDNYEKLDNIRQAVERIDFSNILDIIEDGGMDLSRPIEEQSMLVDGKLYI